MLPIPGGLSLLNKRNILYTLYEGDIDAVVTITIVKHVHFQLCDAGRHPPPVLLYQSGQ